ncbi:hypothetical protein [Streptomyces canus]|uniref:hypothetical protein n=1 Tax=Streptomyces canus TaxID=58343 RepID=UPI00386D38E6
MRAIVDDVHSGLSLVAIAHKLESAGVLVPRDRHAQLQGRPTGGRRHGREFERFRWTAGSLCKILRTPALWATGYTRESPSATLTARPC